MVKRVTDRETGENLACKIMTLPPDGGTAADGESTRTDIFKEIDIIMTLRTCMWFLLNIVAGVCGVVWIVLLLLVCVGVVEERCAHGNLGPWTVGHPNIIYMKEYFEENGRVYVVMEFLAGGELLEALLNKEKGEDGTCFLVVDVAGLCWVHGRRGRRRRFQETLKLCPPTSPERETRAKRRIHAEILTCMGSIPSQATSRTMRSKMPASSSGSFLRRSSICMISRLCIGI